MLAEGQRSSQRCTTSDFLRNNPAAETAAKADVDAADPSYCHHAYSKKGMSRGT